MKQTKMMMKVAETRLGTGLTRGSGSSHLPRKSRVSSNENEPRRWMNFAVLVHNRSAPADGGRLQRLFPSRSKVRTRPALSSDLDERARSVGRPEVYPPFSGSFQISRENLVNACTRVRDLPGSTTVHRTHGRSGTFGAIARVVIPHRPRTSLQTRVIRFASPSTHLRGFASLAG